MEKDGEGWRRMEKDRLSFHLQRETLDPSLDSSLRALSASAQCHWPQRSSNSSFGRKTSQERWSKFDLEDPLHLALSSPFWVEKVADGDRLRCMCACRNN